MKAMYERIHAMEREMKSRDSKLEAKLAEQSRALSSEEAAMKALEQDLADARTRLEDVT